MAIVSLVALLAALGLAALISLQPWAASSVAPRLSVAPGLGIALDDSVVVSPARRLAIAPGRLAGGTPGASAGREVVEETVARPEPAIAPARPVTAAPPSQPPESSPSPPTSEPSPPPPSSSPVAVPVAVPPPAPSPDAAVVPPAPEKPGHGSNPSGPIPAGTPPVGGGGSGAVLVREGDERAFSFSFLVQPTAYLSPGSENLILRFKSAAGELPTLGLQLWDDGNGGRGLWASGDAMGDERFLAPLAEGAWHEAVVCFRASSGGDGFYLLVLDGVPIDARAWVSLIEPGSSDTSIETGLFRDGERVLGTPDVLFGPTRLGDSLESVIP